MAIATSHIQKLDGLSIVFYHSSPSVHMTLVMYAMVTLTTPSVEVTQALPIIEKSIAVIKSPAIPQVPYGQEYPVVEC